MNNFKTYVWNLAEKPNFHLHSENRICTKNTDFTEYWLPVWIMLKLKGLELLFRSYKRIYFAWLLNLTSSFLLSGSGWWCRLSFLKSGFILYNGLQRLFRVNILATVQLKQLFVLDLSLCHFFSLNFTSCLLAIIACKQFSWPNLFFVWIILFFSLWINVLLSVCSGFHIFIHLIYAIEYLISINVHLT